MFSKHTPAIKQFIISSSQAGRKKNVAHTTKYFKVAYGKLNTLFVAHDQARMKTRGENQRLIHRADSCG